MQYDGEDFIWFHPRVATVSEFMWPAWNDEARKRGAAGRTFVAQVKWDQPNKLA